MLLVVVAVTPWTKQALAPAVQPFAGLGGWSQVRTIPWSGIVQVRPAWSLTALPDPELELHATNATSGATSQRMWPG
jgi:hypothetical protein